MADNKVLATISPVTQALQILFNRSPRHMEILKGEEQRTEAKYGLGDSLEDRLSQVFVGYSDVATDRISKYRDYDRMDLESTECHTALSIYAEEASQLDTKTGLKMWVESPSNPKIAEELNGMFQRINMEAKAYGIYRNIAKYGDCFVYNLLGTYGIHDIYFVHPSRVARVQDDGLLGFKSNDLANLTQVDNKNQLFKPWDFIHFRLLNYDQENVYGKSELESLRKVWKQLSMLECYDEQTEILTKNKGWIPFNKVEMSDLVATRNPDTKEFEWQNPTEIVSRPHNGDMIELKSRSVDLLVTPDHRILLTGGTPNNLEGPIEKQANGEIVIRAQELLGRTNRGIGMPVTSKWIGEEIKSWTFTAGPTQVKSIRNGIEINFTTKGPEDLVITGDDYCALMGMWLSEGCMDKNGGIRISQEKKSKGYETFKETLKNINGGIEATYDEKYFYLQRKALNPYFSQFGKAVDKFIPKEIMNATPEQIRIFFDHYVLGDGSFRKYKNAGKKHGNAPVLISTVSKKMADQFMEIAQKLGWAASITVRPAHKQINKRTGKEMDCKESYTVNIKYSKMNSFVANKIQYKGNVYCVKVPNTIVYVRRNGKAAWSGNTMICLYRIAKSVQRNIFYVDVGQASGAETTQILKEYEKFLKNKTTFVDPKTKDFRLDFNPATMLQDIVWPTRPNSLSKVEYLQNTNQMGPLEDLEYFRNKIRSGLQIPKDYFDGEFASGLWRANEALQLQDRRFARRISKFQDAMRDGMVRLCQIHWAITHGEYLDAKMFDVRMGTLSDSADRAREEILIRKGQNLMLLAAVGDAMGWNKQVWSDYLLDQVYPLPPELRDKLFTPDPTTLLASQEGIQTIKNIQVSGVDPDAVANIIGTSTKTKASTYVSKRGQGSFMSPGGKLSSFQAMENKPFIPTGQPLTEKEATDIQKSRMDIRKRLTEIAGPTSTEWKNKVKWDALYEAMSTPAPKED